MKRKTLALLFTAVFLLLCAAPFLGLLLTGGSAAGANEVLAVKPALRDRDGKLNSDYLAGWAEYINDRFSLRQEAVTAWAGLNLHEEGTIESDIITGVPFGTEVTVKEIGEVFTRCYVTLEGKLYKGYLWTGYLSKDVPDAAHAKEHHDAIVGSSLAGWDDAGSGESGSSGDWDWGW